MATNSEQLPLLDPPKLECKVQTDRFLNHLIDRAQATVRQFERIRGTDRTDYVIKQQAYWSNVVSALRWALNINYIRKSIEDM